MSGLEVSELRKAIMEHGLVCSRRYGKWFSRSEYSADRTLWDARSEWMSLAAIAVRNG